MRDKCDICGTTKALEYVDFDDGTVMCKKCDKKVGDQRQREIESKHKYAYYLNKGTNTYVIVKRGFSWPAFFFGCFWMLAKGMVWWAIGTFILLAVLSSVFSGVAPVIILIAWIVIARQGNEWYAEHIVKRGYEFKKYVKKPD